MESTMIIKQLRKCFYLTIPHIIIVSAFANTLRHNTFFLLLNPFYYFYKVRNTEFFYLLIALFTNLYLQLTIYCKKIDLKKYFLFTFLSKSFFLFTLKIAFLPQKNYQLIALLAIIILITSLLELLELRIYHPSFAINEPKGYLVLLITKIPSFFKKVFLQNYFAILISFLVFYICESFYFNLLGRIPWYIRTYSLFITYFSSLIIFFTYYLCCEILKFSFDYNIVNCDDELMNKTNFAILKVHNYYFCRLISLFSVKHSRDKILRTKAMINYLKNSVILELKKIYETLQLFAKINDELLHKKYFFVPIVNKIQGLQLKNNYKKVETNDTFGILVLSLKQIFIKRYLKKRLVNQFLRSFEMYNFIREGINYDTSVFLLKDAEKELRYELVKLRSKCEEIERAMGYKLEFDKYFAMQTDD